MALPDPWKLNNDKPFELDPDKGGWSYPTKQPQWNLPPRPNTNKNPSAPDFNLPSGSSSKKPGPIGLPNPDVPKDPRYNQTNIAVDKFAQNVKLYHKMAQVFNVFLIFQMLSYRISSHMV